MKNIIDTFLMRKLLLNVLVWLSCTVATAQTSYPLLTSYSGNYQTIKDGFASPPNESRLRCYWWWLNSMATKVSITRDLEQMKLKGYGGASIIDAGSSQYSVATKPAAGPVFMSPEWMELFQYAVKEAQRVGIELSVNVQSGWNPGGPSITPDLALKKIVYTETKVRGGGDIEIILPQPETKLLYRDIMVQAVMEPASNVLLGDSVIKNWGLKSFNQSFGFKGTYPLYRLREESSNAEKISGLQSNQIINVTAHFKNGTLKWKAPAGEWTIIRYGWTCTGTLTSTTSDGWSGLSLDHLDPKAFKKFSDDVIMPLIRKAKAAGNSLHFLQTDSWEMGNVGWTDDFANEFKKFRGYDITPCLPVLTGRVVGSVDQSNRFLHDYRLTVGDCIAVNHYKLFYNLAHQNNLGIHPESGGPHSAPVDALKVMAISDFPQGEFWATANTHRIKDDERLAVKQSACVAHTNGKRFVAAEGPTSIGPQWERAPKDLKSNIDRVFCSGVNRIVWHTFTSSPEEFGKPGNEYFAGTHLNPNVTWWKQSGEFISYLNRCSYMLSQGLFNADVLYYYGDDVPNFVFLREEVKDLGFGHDWDKCSKEALIGRLTVKENRAFFSDGMNYKLLVLPPETAIDLEVLRKVESLVKQGLTVIGPRPVKATGLSNYPESDKEVMDIASHMWGPVNGTTTKEHQYGKGKVIWGKDVNTVLAEMKVKPDFAFTSTLPNTGIDYIHRSTSGMEIYFVANRFGRKEFTDFEYHDIQNLPDRHENIECAFRVTGMVPEIWDPQTGKTKQVVVYKEENGQTFIPLSLGPEESQFIVFRKSVKPPHIISIQKDGKKLFPENEFKGLDKAYLQVDKVNGKAAATFYEPGNYVMTWSDGKTTRQNITAPVSTLSLSDGWLANFDTRWGGPASINIDTLRSWTLFEEDGIKYYSGTVLYKKTFSVDAKLFAGKKIVLDLGNVGVMASITINGTTLPVKWNAPFQFDITRYIKSVNQLDVEVVNLWANRLIGDSGLPAEKRLTKTNIKKFDVPGSEKVLRLSGLMGPVQINFINYAILNK